MSHREFIRDCAAITLATGVLVAAVGLLGGAVTLALVLVAAPAIAWTAVAVTLIRGGDAAADEWCARIDRELDDECEARARLRVIRTVHAEPQPNVVDLWTREPVA